MKSMEFTIDGISPIDFAPWNGVKVSAQITVMKETMCVRIELPPPVCSFMERLQREFSGGNIPVDFDKVADSSSEVVNVGRVHAFLNALEKISSKLSDENFTSGLLCYPEGNGARLQLRNKPRVGSFCFLTPPNS